MALRPPAQRPAFKTLAPSSRKRFIDPDGNPTNFSEGVGSNLEDNPRTCCKGRVRTEGHESDSSVDCEGFVSSRKPVNDGKDGGGNMFTCVAVEEKKKPMGRRNI